MHSRRRGVSFLAVLALGAAFLLPLVTTPPATSHRAHHAAAVRTKLADDSLGLPSGCTDDGFGFVTCSYTSGSNTLALSTGASSVTYKIAGGAGNGPDNSGQGGQGSIDEGSLGAVAGSTLHIGVGQQGGNNPDSTYGNFSGGNAGSGHLAGSHDGDHGGAATTVGSDNVLLAVAGGGGGGGGNYFGTGGSGGNAGVAGAGNRVNNEEGGNGGGHGSGAGGGGGGGGGGYWAGNGGATCSACTGGGGQGGSDDNFGSTTLRRDGGNSGGGYADIYYWRSTPSITVSAPSAGTVYAWQRSLSIPYWVGGNGAATGSVSVTDTTTDTQVCASTTLTTGSGTCTLGGSALDVGSHTLRFDYGGDSGYLATSTSITFTVLPDPVNVALSTTEQGDGTYAIAATATPSTSDGIAEGTLALSLDSTSQVFTDSCRSVTAPTAAEGRRDVPVSLNCTPALLPGAHTVTATFTYPDTTTTTNDTTFTIGKYATTQRLTLSPKTLASYGQQTTATVRVTQPSSAQANVGGSVTVAPTSGTSPGCTTSVGTLSGLTTTFTCSFAPKTGDQEYRATYSGDANYAGGTSDTDDVSTTQATPTLTLSADKSTIQVGNPITLTAAATDAADNALTTGTVSIYDGPVAPDQSNLVGTIDLAGHPGGGTVTVSPSAGTHVYYAQYVDADGNYYTVTVPAPAVVVQPLRADIALAVVGNSSAATSQGIPTTVTTTITMDPTDTLSAPITMTPAPAAACDRSETTTATDRVITSVCHYVEQPGATPAFRADYTDALVGSPTKSENVYVIPASPTSVTATATSVDYGAAPLFTATVTPTVDGTAVAGSVQFSEGGSVLCANPVALSSGLAEASCSPGSVVHAGDHAVTAKFVPDVVDRPLTLTSTAQAPASFTVRRDPVSIGLSTSRTSTKLTVSVAASVDDDSSAPTPTGSIAFGADVSSCGTVALADGVANCVVDLPAAGAKVTLSASYVASADFHDGASPSASTSWQLPASGPCSAGFATFWDRAQALSAHSTFDEDAGTLGSVRLTIGTGIGTCDAAASMTVDANVSLFGGTLTADDLSASVSQTQGLCLNSGHLSMPSVWNTGAVAITQAICLPLTDDGGLGKPTQGALALANGGSATLPLLAVPGVTGAASLSARIGTACPGEVVGSSDCTTPASALTVTGVVAPASSSVPGVTVVATVAADGGIHASVTSTAWNVFGTSVQLGGTVGRDSSTSPLTASVSATLASSASPATGLTLLSGATISLAGGTSSDGTTKPTPTLTVDGTVRVAAGTPAQVDVALHGSFTSADSYDLSLATSSPAPSWTPVTGLTFSPVLSGSLQRSGGSTSFALSAAAAGNTPLVTWSAPGGVTMAVQRISLGGDPTSTDADCPFTTGLVAALSGSMTVGDLSVGSSGCVSLADGGWHLGATVKTASVSAMNLSDLVLNVTHPAGGSTSVLGSATASVSAGSFAGSTTVTMSVENGVFVIGGQIDATSFGLTSTYLAYASAPATGWQTGLSSVGNGGVVDLPTGVSVFGAMTLSNSVATVLKQAKFSLPSDATVTFTASIAKGATGLSFTAALATPSGFPLLTLPGGATITSAVLTYADHAFGLVADGTVRGQDGSAAPIHLDVSITGTGDLTGSASVTGLSLFGRTIDLSGSVRRSSGILTADVSGTLTGTIDVGDATLSDVTVTLGTTGLSAEGTLAVASASVAFTAVFASTSSYSLTVSTTVRNWTPASGVSVNAEIDGAVTHTAAGFTYDFSATPLTGGSLISITPASGVTLTLDSFELSNAATPPGDCPLTSARDTWLAASGSLSVSLGSANASADGSGCFDLTHPSFSLTVAISTGSFGDGSKVALSDLTITVHKAGSDFSVDGHARLNVQMPSGGQFSLAAVLTFGSDGFAIGGLADLSSYLGGSAASAYLFYANAQMSVDTGDATLGTLALKPGVTVGLDFTVGSDVAQAMQHLGVNVGAGTSLAATVHLDLDSATVTMTVALAFQQTTIFSTSNGTYLRADSLALDMTLSPTQPSFGLAVAATLHVPSTVPGGSPSDIGLSGGISIGTQLSAYLSVTNWNDAFGISGLRLQELTLQGGITLSGLPLPSLAISASVDGLPQKLADVIGYQQGVPISIALAVGETNLLLDLKIGTKDSQQVALAPFAMFGKADLLEVNYAELYISPTGATIGDTTYPAGFALGFQGELAGVSVDVFAKIDPIAASFYFRGSLGQINVGAISIGPTTLTIDVSPSTFQITFSGHLAIGPATTYIGPALKFSGYLSADVSLSVGTDGISAHMNLDASVTGSNYLPQGWCKWHGIWVLCDYAWVDDSPLNVHIDNLGFDLNSDGLTIDIPDTESSIHFPFPGHSSSSLAARPLTAGAGPVAQTLNLSAFHLPLAHPRTASAAPDAGSSWQRTGSMGSARIVAGSLPLRDGSVLVAGGTDAAGHALNTAEIYRPGTGGWVRTGALHVARINPTLVQLRNGKVLAVGGDTGRGETAAAEVWDPGTRRWTVVASMPRARQGAAATVLSDGRVLVIGGHVAGKPVADVDIFDPSTGRWARAQALHTARAAAAVATTAAGDIVVAGGMGAHGPLRTVEIFDLSTGAWSAAQPMAHARFYAAATRLRDGRILVAGDAAQSETYDPATGRWTVVGSQHGPALLSSMVTLPNGHVLVAGGLSFAGSLAQVDEFDPSTNRWTARAALPVAVGAASASLVGDNVLIAGGLHGRSASDAAYVYAPDGTRVPNRAFSVEQALPAHDANGRGWLIGGVVLVMLALSAGGVLVVARRRRTSGGAAAQ